MSKLTEKKLCDICEKIVKIRRLQDGSGITEDIFKGVKKAKVVLKNLAPVGRKLINDLVKGFNQGKISLEEAVRQASPIVQNLFASKSGSGFTSATITAESIGSGAVLAGEGYSNLPLGTATSQDGEGAVLAGEGAVLAGEIRTAGKGSFPKHKVLGLGKKTNPWLVHLKAFREKNPGMSYKVAMSKAKLTYKK